MIENNLRKYIDEKGFTIKKKKKKTGIRYATIWAIVNGKNTLINTKYLSKIMEAINISSIELIMKKRSNRQVISDDSSSEQYNRAYKELND